jgi:hypothetical protein
MVLRRLASATTDILLPTTAFPSDGSSSLETEVELLNASSTGEVRTGPHSNSALGIRNCTGELSVPDGSIALHDDKPPW